MTPPSILDVRHVSKTFDQVRVLDNLTMQLSSADGITALTGPNAAGKSTFFEILTGFQHPDPDPAAVVRVFDTSVLDLQPWEVSRLGVARLFQDARVFSGLTVLQNVQVAANSAIRFTVWKLLGRPRGDAASLEALDFVGLANRRHDLAGVLSLGDRRKLAIACILRTDARLLLLDEPTSNLDSRTTDQMKELVRRVAREQKTVVIIEHNREFLRDVADTVFTLHQGQCSRVQAGQVKEFRAVGEQT